jgi:hypothetical protein
VASRLGRGQLLHLPPVARAARVFREHVHRARLLRTPVIHVPDEEDILAERYGAAEGVLR